MSSTPSTSFAGRSILGTGTHAAPSTRLAAWCLGGVFVAIPLNGIPGPSVLRELSTEAALYPIVLFCIVMGGATLTRVLTTRAAAILFAGVLFLAINLYVNFRTINGSQLGDTSGLDRFTSSLFVFAFYAFFSFCLVTFFQRVSVAELRAGMNSIIRLAAVLLILVWSLEVSSWFSPTLRQLLDPLKRAISTGPYFSTFRLSGVSFEPSFNAIVMVGLFPILIYGALSRANTNSLRYQYRILALLFLIFGAASSSRTAYSALSGEALFALAIVVAAGRGSAFSSFVIGRVAPLIAILLAPILLLYLGRDVSHLSVTEDGISNITRLTAINAAIQSWIAHPIFGVGFGQFGFQYRSTISLVSTASFEVADYAWGARWNRFPPSYSLYWRILAEAGLAGAILFYGIWLVALVRMGSLLKRMNPSSDEALLAWCTGIGLFGALMVGLSFDSYRAPFLWIYGALATALPAIVKHSQKKRGSGQTGVAY